MDTLAEYWFNTTDHSSTGLSPFEAVYGRPPPSLLSYVPDATDHSLVDNMLRDREEILALLKDNLTRAQDQMKKFADRRRTAKEFSVGDAVLLRLQPYRQNSLRSWKVQKLAARYYGPYVIEERIGAAAYHLCLPPESKIHPVFHVSQLREYHSKPSTISVGEPTLWEEVAKVPEMVLHREMRKKGHAAATYLLIKWKHHPAEEATWMEHADFDIETMPTLRGMHCHDSNEEPSFE